jgi:hypothetical protein
MRAPLTTPISMAFWSVVGLGSFISNFKTIFKILLKINPTTKKDKYLVILRSKKRDKKNKIIGAYNPI